jgi:hypothetical protein
MLGDFFTTHLVALPPIQLQFSSEQTLHQSRLGRLNLGIVKKCQEFFNFIRKIYIH